MIQSDPLPVPAHTPNIPSSLQMNVCPLISHKQPLQRVINQSPKGSHPRQHFKWNRRNVFSQDLSQSILRKRVAELICGELGSHHLIQLWSRCLFRF